MYFFWGVLPKKGGCDPDRNYGIQQWKNEMYDSIISHKKSIT